MEALSAVKEHSIRLAWEAARLVRLFGAVRLAGCACIAGALVLAALAWHLERLSVAEEEQQRRSAVHFANQRKSPAASVDERIAGFYAGLPDSREFSHMLKSMEACASRHGLALLRGNYKPQLDSNANLLRYRVTLPVQGEYAAIDGFLSELFASMPSLAMEGITFKRERGDVSNIEASLSLVLVMRPATGRVR